MTGEEGGGIDGADGPVGGGAGDVGKDDGTVSGRDVVQGHHLSGRGGTGLPQPNWLLADQR